MSDKNEQQEIDRCIAYLKERGYRVNKIQAYVPIERCVCGEKRTHEVFSVHGYGVARACSNCGLRGDWMPSSRKARDAYNKAVREARASHEQ